MCRLAEIRNQEMMCRERALLETDSREFWLAKADEWAQRAVDEIALQLRERSGTGVTGAGTYGTDTAKAPTIGI